MAWVKIDDSFADHPKIASAGPLGMALQVAALCYCNRYLTDGFIPRAMAPRLVYFEGFAEPHDVITRLIEVGIWIEVEGGYRIHDYLEYQPSKADIEATREQRRKAGAKGGKAKGKGDTPSKQSGKQSAKQGAKRGAKQDAKQNASNVLSKEEAKLCPVPVPVPGPVPKPNTPEGIQTDRPSAGNTEGEHPAAPVSPSVDDPLSRVTAAYHAHIGVLGPSQFDRLRHWHDEMGMPADVIVEAIAEAADKGNKRIDYINGILTNWRNDGVTTVEDARTRRKPRGDPRVSPGKRETAVDRMLRERGVWPA